METYIKTQKREQEIVTSRSKEFRIKAKVDQEDSQEIQLSVNIQHRVYKNHLYIPIPSKSKVKEIFSSAFKSKKIVKPSQIADLSDKKAKVINGGFKKIEKGNIFNFKKRILNDLNSLEKIKEVRNGLKSINKETQKSTDESQNEELKREEKLYFEEIDEEEEDSEIDEELLTFEKREKQRVKEAKRMVLEVMGSLKSMKKGKNSEFCELQKSGKLIDFEYRFLSKVIKKSNKMERMLGYYGSKFEFFIGKIEKRIRKSLLVSKVKKKKKMEVVVDLVAEN